MDAGLNFFAHVCWRSFVIEGEGIRHGKGFCSSARAELPADNCSENAALKAIVVEGRVLNCGAGDLAAGFDVEGHRDFALQFWRFRKGRFVASVHFCCVSFDDRLDVVFDGGRGQRLGSKC